MLSTSSCAVGHIWYICYAINTPATVGKKVMRILIGTIDRLSQNVLLVRSDLLPSVVVAVEQSQNFIKDLFQ
jgi:hypothetical protein